MIVITNRLPLRTLYPKPEEKCNIISGNLDANPPVTPEISSLLYRVSYKFRSIQTGEVYQDLVANNFIFNTVNTSGSIKAGSLVTYQPKNKEDPNYGMIAQVKKVTAPITNVEAVRMGGPRSPDPQKMFFDIEFLAPREVGGKVISTKTNLRKKDLKLYHEGDLVYSYECGPDFINYDLTNGSSRKLEAFYQARNNFRSSQSVANRTALEAAENNLWNSLFVLDKNNQPKYPDIQTVPKDIHSSNPDDNLEKYLNEMVERMVTLGFTPNDASVSKRILGKKPNLKARFPVPRGVKRGQKITINIGGKDIVVKIPESNTEDNTWDKVLKINQMVESPIDRDDNSGVYDSLSSSVKNKGDLEFLPTVIKAEFARGKDVKVLNMDKMIPPPKDQQFFIKGVKIKKNEDGNNWKFKELDVFDKDIEQLVIDLEVKVDLELGVRTKYKDGEKPGLMGKLGDMIGNSLLSSNSCPRRMDSLAESFGTLKNKVTPPLSDDEQDRRELEKAVNLSNHMTDKENTRVNNINTGRREVRKGGRRKRKTRRKNYKKKRRTLRLNYIKDDYRKSRKRNRKKRTKRRR